MGTQINCAEGTLSPFIPSLETPWNAQRVLHLFRRVSFGALPQDVSLALSQTPAQMVDNLINDAQLLSLPPQPEWANYTIDDYENIAEEVGAQVLESAYNWTMEMTTNYMRDRMSWFWHNHFVAKLDDYGFPSYLNEYKRLLQKHALGNFKDFVYDIGLTPAMLIFLNGVQNTRFDPNENYARELYELFCLGADNGYTQTDIQETARALTGWNDIPVLGGPIGFINAFHDNGNKTIFGKTGNWKYDDVINILFEEKGQLIAEHICKKIYTHFVNPEIDELIALELADILLENNFEMAPMLSVLFKSEHFFDEKNISTIITGPMEFFINYLKEIPFQFSQDTLNGVVFFSSELNQRIFNPVDVAGWPGNRNWIDSNSSIARWDGTLTLLLQQYQVNNEIFRDFALSICGDENNDVEWITHQIVDYLIPKKLQTPQMYEFAVVYMKDDVPMNYFEDGSWNLYWDSVPKQVVTLLYYLTRLPEFQLK